MQVNEQPTLFDLYKIETKAKMLSTPSGYKGLAAFHKYWGKKPVEPLAFLVENLTVENDIVLDPFLGSALITRECLLRNRRFVGIDINPVSIELGRLWVDLPCAKDYETALAAIEKEVRPRIDASYQLTDGRTATHYLWEDGEQISVWINGARGKAREELKPSKHDVDLLTSYEGYPSCHIRNLRLFQNSRINTKSSMTLRDLFTGRALRNMDFLLDAILKLAPTLRRAMLLTLTSASGQMSNMVFAISKRGKTNGRLSKKIEVGSWAIGLWRPAKHFEINVWNCFNNRARKMLKALRGLPPHSSVPVSDHPSDVFKGSHVVSLINDNCNHVLSFLPSNSVALILTDPPHSDRMPYLELSEFWNAILQYEPPDFDHEIVVSNAKDRKKNGVNYNSDMKQVIVESYRVLKPGACMIILFNAKDVESWDYLRTSESIQCRQLQFRGCFPLKYSAGSIVQDNRKGAMKHDYALVYQKGKNDETIQNIRSIPGWRDRFPE